MVSVNTLIIDIDIRILTNLCCDIGKKTIDLFHLLNSGVGPSLMIVTLIHGCTSADHMECMWQVGAYCKRLCYENRENRKPIKEKLFADFFIRKREVAKNYGF